MLSHGQDTGAQIVHTQRACLGSSNNASYLLKPSYLSMAGGDADVSPCAATSEVHPRPALGVGAAQAPFQLVECSGMCGREAVGGRGRPRGVSKNAAMVSSITAPGGASDQALESLGFVTLPPAALKHGQCKKSVLCSKAGACGGGLSGWVSRGPPRRAAARRGAWPGLPGGSRFRSPQGVRDGSSPWWEGGPHGGYPEANKTQGMQNCTPAEHRGKSPLARSGKSERGAPKQQSPRRSSAIA
jgi:hypothetical protein